MKIFEKIKNETSVCFRKTVHKERENWLRSTVDNEQLFSLYDC